MKKKTDKKKTMALIAAVLVSGGLTFGAAHAEVKSIQSVVGAGMAKTTSDMHAEDKTAWKASLTDDQKACLESHGCPKISKDEKKNMTAEELAAARKCKADAFAACGIEKPDCPSKATVKIDDPNCPEAAARAAAKAAKMGK